MKNDAVDIFEFECQRHYLAAVLTQRRQAKSSQSLRQLAKRAGFRSPATLSMIISGKRGLSLMSAEKIARALALTGRRRRYFLAMSRLNQSKSAFDQARIREELYRIKSAAEENPLDIRQYRCLGVWYYPVIYTLLGQRDFQPDPHWIAMRLKGEVTPLQVTDALTDMKSVGMIRQSGDSWEQVSGPLSTRDDIKDAGIVSYHAQMLEQARLSMELPLEDRELNGLTVSLSKQQLPVVKEKIRKFRKDLHEYLTSFHDGSDVYQLNIQFFPHTQQSTPKTKKHSKETPR